MAKRLGMYCMHCGSRAQIRTSESLTPTLRKVYFLCEKVFCGHSWLAHLEAIHTISPSGLPNPKVELPILSRSEVERVFDLINETNQGSFFDVQHNDSPEHE